MRRLLACLTTFQSASAVWVYTWPYSAANKCKCVEQNIGSLISFDTADDCLKSFAAEDEEYCTYENEGLSQHKCAEAVSKRVGMYNTDCQTMCNEMLTSFISEEEFFESCSLELVAQIGGAVAPAAGRDSCFSNHVYGWADFDPHNNLQGSPVAIHHEVDSAPACQELCQMTKTCVYFSYKATCNASAAPDAGTAAGKAGKAASDYQSAVGTCLLYDSAYMEGVLSVDTTNPAELVLAGNSKYCNSESLSNNCNLNVMNNSTFFFPFGANKSCLLCGCVQKCAWNSPTHITGPKFCGDKTQNACKFPLSDVTTTSTAPNCPAQTCAVPPNTAATTIPNKVKPTEPPATTTAVELDTTTAPERSTTTGIELDTTTVASTTQTTGARPPSPTCAQCHANCGDDDDCDCDEYC